jgi:hypothetical protein
MVRVVAILAGIFLVAYVAVHLGYARLEKELLGRSCCGITELPITELPIPVNKNQAEGEKSNQPVSGSPVTNMPQAPTPSTPEVQKTKENSEEPTDAGSPERSPADAPPLPAEGQPVNNENPDFQVIAQRNIFQLVQEEQPTSSEKQQPTAIPQTAPEEVPTTLNLTLLGTVLGDDQTSRAIIIEEKQNEQKLYQIGDAVQGAIIESIERGKVILEVFGAKETLMMKKREGGGPGPPRLPARISRPVVPRPVPDPVQDDIEEVQEDELIEEKQVQTTRRPPSIRPHRRINFRRNPIRNTPETPGMDAEEEDFIEEEMPVPEEELPPLD